MKKAGFQQEWLLVKTANGADDVLVEPLVFRSSEGRLYRAPKGATTDGFSVPRCLRNIIPATGGDWFSSVMHDAAYRGTLELFINKTWKRVLPSKRKCDWLILDAMRLQGTGWLRRSVIYWGVRLFGGHSFRKDRKTIFRPVFIAEADSVAAVGRAGTPTSYTRLRPT